jgi:hypothetical protein
MMCVLKVSFVSTGMEQNQKFPGAQYRYVLNILDETDVSIYQLTSVPDPVRKTMVRICGTGSVPKFQGSGTLQLTLILHIIHLK